MTPTNPRTSFVTPVIRLRILLCLLLALLMSVEYLTRVMHGHRNATQAIENGIRQALLIRGDPKCQQLLFAGNSLIFDDLSQADLQQGMSPVYIVHMAGVPGSTYYDWRYGLHALFARGSQPDVLIFSISPSQFLRRPATTPLPVSTLWSVREIVAYYREQNTDLSTLSELLLEHYSSYFSLRNTVRIHARKVIPGYESMIYGWSPPTLGPQLNAGPETEALFSDRLSKLAAECGSHTRLMLMLPPTNQLEDDKLQPALRAAAEKLGIAVIEPIGEKDWPLTRFREDGYHLTLPAAAEFSKLVAADLKTRLAESSNHGSGR